MITKNIIAISERMLHHAGRPYVASTGSSACKLPASITRKRGRPRGGFFSEKIEIPRRSFWGKHQLPSGNLQHSYWKSPFFMGKSIINGDLVMLVYQRVYIQIFGLFGLFLSFDSLRFSGWNSMEMLLIVKWDEQLTLRMWTTNMTRHMHIWVWINTY